MKLVGILSTAVLSLTLGAVVPAYAQDQHDQQQEDKDKATQQDKDKKVEPAKPEEKKAQEEKNAKPEENKAQEERSIKPEEKNAQQRPEEGKPVQHAAGGRIPDDRYKANFGREHTFRVSEGDYRNHRFQYGGYSFGFVDAWPSNWLYTQDLFVVDIGGIYYLCNPAFPGVNVALSVTL
jgi:hypothetical protein